MGNLMKRHRRSRLAKRQDKPKDYFRDALAPLARGHPVKIALSYEKVHGRVRRTVSYLVLVTPGSFYGMRKALYVVAVVGKGSCIIDTGTTKGLADLTKAGIPTALAKAFLSKLNSIAGE